MKHKINVTYDYKTEEIPAPEIVSTPIQAPINPQSDQFRLMYYTGGGNAKMTGIVTGNVYLFREGLPTQVDERDVPDLLSKVKQGACCGSNAPYQSKLFELV